MFCINIVFFFILITPTIIKRYVRIVHKCPHDYDIRFKLLYDNNKRTKIREKFEMKGKFSSALTVLLQCIILNECKKYSAFTHERT